jgi:hypothetical protein
MTAVNNLTSDHGVVASLSSPLNKITGTVGFPNTGVDTNVVFTVNGTTITVASPSITYGFTGPVGWWDFVRAINEQTDVHGVYATVDPNTGFVSFENDSGGPINFANVHPTTSASGITTFTDTLGVQANNAPAAATKMKFARPDGGEIVVSDITGTFLSDSGIQSAANGALPLALVVDQAMYANSSYMVNSVADRDALQNLRTGDQVYVQADLDGEWALYIKVDTGWTKIANADSASTDAKTLQIDLTSASATPILLGNISSGTRIVDVTIEVGSAFNGTTPTITIGTQSTPNAVFDSANADLTVIGNYETNSAFVADTEDGSDVDIYVYLQANGSTAGTATVIVSYL